LLVTLLNEANAEVKAVHESGDGQKLLKGRNVLARENDDDVHGYELDSRGNVIARTVRDKLDIGIEMEGALPEEGERRTRRPVDRFVPEKEKEKPGKKTKTVKKSPKMVTKRPKTVKQDDDEHSLDSELSDMDDEKTDSEYDDEEAEEDDSGSDSDGLPYQSETQQQDELADMDEDDSKIEAIHHSSLSNQKKRYAVLNLFEKEKFDQERMNLEYLLEFNPNTVYTEKSLENERILDRALRLLYRARFGQEKENARIGVHIKYTNLPKAVIAALQTANTILTKEEKTYLKDRATGKQVSRYASWCGMETTRSMLTLRRAHPRTTAESEIVSTPKSATSDPVTSTRKKRALPDEGEPTSTG
jgi:hypothetical protein